MQTKLNSSRGIKKRLSKFESLFFYSKNGGGVNCIFEL